VKDDKRVRELEKSVIGDELSGLKILLCGQDPRKDA
jgi:hypothetical protein